MFMMLFYHGGEAPSAPVPAQTEGKGATTPTAPIAPIAPIALCPVPAPLKEKTHKFKLLLLMNVRHPVYCAITLFIHKL